MDIPKSLANLPSFQKLYKEAIINGNMEVLVCLDRVIENTDYSEFFKLALSFEKYFIAEYYLRKTHNIEQCSIYLLEFNNQMPDQFLAYFFRLMNERGINWKKVSENIFDKHPNLVSNFKELNLDN